MRAGPDDAGSGSEMTAGTLQFVIAIQNPKVPPNPQLHLFTSLMLGTETLRLDLWHRGSGTSTGNGIVLPSYDLQVTVAQKEPKTGKEESWMESSQEVSGWRELCCGVGSLSTCDSPCHHQGAQNPGH